MKTKKLFLLGAALLSISIFAACASNDGNEAAPSNASLEENRFQSGIFSAEVPSVWDYITVYLTTSENAIENVEIIHNDFGLFVDTPIENLISSVLDAQSPFVDAISQATATTSNAIAALQLAYQFATGQALPEAAPRFISGSYVGLMRDYKGGQAQEGVDSSGSQVSVALVFSDNEILSASINTHMNTGEEPTEEDNAILEQLILDAQGPFEPLEHLPLTSHNLSLAVEYAIRIAEGRNQHIIFDLEGQEVQTAHNLSTGVYFITVDGRNDDLTLGVGVLSGIIQRAAIIHRDTPGIVDDAVAILARDIVLNQAYGIDGVSGATNTSVAILEALEEFINQASN